MKNTLLPALAVLLTTGVAAAQGAGNFRNNIKTGQRGYAVMQRPSAMIPAAKTTGLKARLISASDYGSGGLIDTARYFYSGNRVNLPVSAVNELAYQPTAYLVPYNNGVPIYSPDSALYYQVMSGSLQLTARTVLTYTPTNKVATDSLFSSYNGGPWTQQALQYSYGPDDYISEVVQYDSLQPGPAPLKPHYVHYNLYNSLHFLVYDSSVNPLTGLPATKNVYTVNAAGDPVKRTEYFYVSGQWKTADSTITVYDAMHRATSATNYGLTNYTTISTETRDSFRYGAGTLITYQGSETFNLTTHIWKTDFYITFKLNGAGDNYDTSVSYVPQGAGFTRYDMQVPLYNADGTLHEVDHYSYTASVPNPATPDEKTYLYYEQYNDATGIAAAAKQSTLAIYPNPATDMLWVKPDITGALPAMLCITDAAGREVSRQSVDGRNTAIMNISGLPAGSYTISAASGAGERLQSAVFIKQ